MLIPLSLGLTVGLILALTGTGGGILAVPLLVFGTHIGVAQAGPIDAFTGDTLLIDGCGRTDFQSGSANALYDSVTRKLFALSDDTWVWPGHDYKGQSVSTIGWEKRHNSRLANRGQEAFVKLMDELNLPKPKLIDVAVPANQNLGLPHGG